MIFDVLTLFPEMFVSPLDKSILKRAIEKNIIHVRIINIREFAVDKHRTVDDRPYGGGEGMVMKVEPIARAVRSIKNEDNNARTILLTPQGRLFRQSIAEEISKYPHLVLICGRYEGVDERVKTCCVDDEISIGDYVLTGGELPALVVIDAVTRLLPGVLGGTSSVEEESFRNGLLEYPQYTRPHEFEGNRIPEILLSGDHNKIRKWRRREQLKRTLLRRPDLLEVAALSKDDLKVLDEIRRDLDSGDISD